MLLLHVQARFAKAMRESVLIHFLEMTVPVIAMNRESSLSDPITECPYVFHKMSFLGVSFLRLLRLFVADILFSTCMYIKSN
jgi:hypothetical protein